MAQAQNGDTVDVRYTATLDDGTVVDSNTDRNPLQFTVGSGEVISGFEEAVVGMNPGDSKTVAVPADKAYGPYQEGMVVEIARSAVPADFEPAVGQQVRVQQDSGGSSVATITEVNDSAIRLDANHPLAGKGLTFEIELLDIV
ncbi:MAG: FKBP-type peptidyl-prolyl cis-trans isomerase [Anaerolineae bacterium]